MRVYHKENLAKKINLNFDAKNYRIFWNKILEIGHKCESDSNPKKLRYSCVMNSVRTPTEEVHGWVNRSQDPTKYCLFFDFDNILFFLLELQIRVILERYNLTKAYVFSTQIDKDSNKDVYGNFLVFIPDLVRFNKIIEIQNDTNCDESYKRLPLIYRFRSWCWRWSPKFQKKKPEYYCIIENPKKPYKQLVSEAHLKLMKQLYPKVKEDLKDFKNLDGSKKLWLVNYKTSSR